MPLFTPCSYMDERLEKQKEKKEEEEKVQPPFQTVVIMHPNHWADRLFSPEIMDT